MERRIYTAQDGEQFEKASESLRKNGLDDWTQEGIQRNADLVDEFFQTNRGIPVTVANIFKAVNARKQDYKWLSAAATEWYEISKKNPPLATELAAFLATQGHPGQLSNEGDSLFQNLVLLLNELYAQPQPIAQAEDRISHRPGHQLHRVPQLRRTEPVSFAAKADSEYERGRLFSGRDLVKQADGSLRSKTAAEQRMDREASERAQSQSQTPVLDATEQAWKNMADQLLQDGTHSQQTRVRAVYEREELGQGSWRRVYEACKREVNAYKNRGIR
jgi:hypothetical protein